MLTRLLWIILAIWSIVALVPVHAAERFLDDCVCRGQPVDYYTGGDKKPLDWAFQSYLAKLGTHDQPTFICYLKRVANSSKMDVRRVQWEIANFYRRYVPPESGALSCETLAGEMKSDPSTGPLYYDVADHYDTTVREPKEGWKKSEYQPKERLYAQAGNPPDFQKIIKDYTPPLESSFVVHLTNSSAAQTANISIVSRAVDEGQKTILYYEFVNTGTAALRLLVNLPNDGLISKDVPIIADPILLEPQKGIKYVSSTQEQVTFQQASLIFYNQPGKEIIGIDSAGFYGLATGNRELEIDKVWQGIKNER
jgi:hypothetical protein